MKEIIHIKSPNGEWSCSDDLIASFNSEEDADEYKKLFSFNDYHSDWYTEKVAVSPHAEYYGKGLTSYKVQMSIKGDYEVENNRHDLTHNLGTFRSINDAMGGMKKENVEQFRKENGSIMVMEIYLFTKDEEDAIKQADEIRIKAIADNRWPNY